MRRIRATLLLILLVPPSLLAQPAGGGSNRTDAQGERFGIGPPPDAGGTFPPIPPPTSYGRGPGESIRAVSQSPWFALASGIASILGLLIPLYATQVRSIPFSLYRALTWRKVLLMAGGFGLSVFAGLKLLSVDPRLGRVFNILDILASDERVGLAYRSGYLETVFWSLAIASGLVLAGLGWTYDPVARARETLIREHKSLEDARRLQVNRLLAGRTTDDGLTTVERRMLQDILDFYRHVEWRYADVVLGAPPPTFPLFRDKILASGEEDGA